MNAVLSNKKVQVQEIERIQLPDNVWQKIVCPISIEQTVLDTFRFETAFKTGRLGSL